MANDKPQKPTEKLMFLKAYLDTIAQARAMVSEPYVLAESTMPKRLGSLLDQFDEELSAALRVLSQERERVFPAPIVETKPAKVTALPPPKADA